ncbi:BrnA antitoxin family protein [Allopusillimonas soli]|uniref:BrnA antitoxin family protein n=1 Tax=Allopusillimonas soli TaxID=659016 RepID=UPI001C55493A
MRLARQQRQRKVLLTVRYDADIIAAFRAEGPGWQTRMNAALRSWLAAKGKV